MVLGEAYKGQAAMELAIFGAIVIFLLGAIIRTALSSGQEQDANLKATRYALLQSYEAGRAQATNRSNSSVTYIEDRLSPDFGKYGSVERAPFMAQGSGTMTNMLQYPLDRVDFLDPKHVPVVDMYINGKHFTFSTANLTHKTFSSFAGRTAKKAMVTTTGGPQSNYGPAKAGGGWDPACNTGEGCPIFYTSIINTMNQRDHNPPIIQPSPSAAAKREAQEKKFCITDPCLGILVLQERFDLNRDDIYDDKDPAPAQYKDMTWQWRGVLAFKGNSGKEKSLYVNEEAGAFPAFDVDGDGKEETIYELEYNAFGTVTGAWVLSSGDGDFDMGADNFEGLKNDTFVSTTMNPGSGGDKLLMKETAGDPVVISKSSKDQLEIITRKIVLSNDTGRMCDGSVPAVEICGNCMGINKEKTCFEKASKTLYVRSRFPDKRGHFWKTDTKTKLDFGS